MNKPLRIAVVSASIYPYQHGGIARWMSDLVPELIQQGHDVRLLTRSLGTRDSRPYLFEVSNNPKSSLLPTAFPHIDKFSTATLETLDDMSAQGWIPDIVYGTAWDCEVLAVIRSKRYKVATLLVTPLKITLQHSGIPDLNADLQTFSHMQELEAECIMHSAALHAISHSIVTTIAREYSLSIAPTSYRIIPLGLPSLNGAAQQPKWNKSPRVLFVGRREERKGIDLFLDAIPDICQKFPRTRFTVAGQEMPSAHRQHSFEENFKTQNTRTLRHRVRFFSNLSDKRLHKLYESHEITCIPSRYESFGLVAVEAMRAGSAPIVADGSGLAEIVTNNHDGLILQSLTTESIVDSVTSLLSNDNLLGGIRQNASSTFHEKYEVSVAVENLVSYFRQVATT